MEGLNKPDRIMAAHADEDEPLNTEDRTVMGMHGSLYVNVTTFAAAIHNVEQGDECTVYTLDDGIYIETQ